MEIEPERDHTNCKPWIIEGEFAHIVGCDCPIISECQNADKSADKTPKALAIKAEKLRIASLEKTGHKP